MRSLLLLLPLLSLSNISANCPECDKMPNSQEVRVRGVLQKKPSTTAHINRNSGDSESEESESE